MSKWISKEYSYYCSSDCNEYGCQGHILTLEFSRTTDIYTARIDGQIVLRIDDKGWGELMEAAKEPK